MSLGFEEAVSARSGRWRPIRFVHSGEKGMARPLILSRGACDVDDGGAVRRRATAGPTMPKRKALRFPLVCGTWPCTAEHGAPAVRRGAIQPGCLLRRTLFGPVQSLRRPVERLSGRTAWQGVRPGIGGAGVGPAPRVAMCLEDACVDELSEEPLRRARRDPTACGDVLYGDRRMVDEEGFDFGPALVRGAASWGASRGWRGGGASCGKVGRLNRGN